MELTTYQLLYKTLSVVKTILVFLFIMLFIYNSYSLYLQNATVLMDYLKFSSKTTSSNGVLTYAFAQLHLVKNLALMLAILFIAYFIYSRFPISNKKIIQWDQNKEIDPILGRSITYHLRYNKSLNTRQLYYFYQLAQFEKNMLVYHINNSHLDNFMKKYDENFNLDLE